MPSTPTTTGRPQADSPHWLEPAPSADEFWCLRYQIWYPTLDCAVRTKFRTCAGCLNCEQGRFNLKRHAAALERVRLPILTLD